MIGKSSVSAIEVRRHENHEWEDCPDLLVVEEPLEIRIGYGPADDRQQMSLAVTMRTPGQDLDLVAGFLFTEGILEHPNDIRSLEHCLNVEKEEEVGNVVKAELNPEVNFDPALLNRHFYTTSSCGVCGKSSIDAIETTICRTLPSPTPMLETATLIKMPDLIREAQTVFKHTGGIHATGIFDQAGKLLVLREDVGRHNAMDKAIGSRWMREEWGGIALASGRLSFELVQKALRAGIPILAAVGAPSSLAVDLAKAHDMTLVGFLRNSRFNVYCGKARIV